MKIEILLRNVLLSGIIGSLLLIFLGYQEIGAIVLILTPLARNVISGLWSFREGAYLFAFLAFFTVGIILFT